MACPGPTKYIELLFGSNALEAALRLMWIYWLAIIHSEVSPVVNSYYCCAVAYSGASINA